MGKRTVFVIETPFTRLSAVMVLAGITDIPIGIIDRITSFFLAVFIIGFCLNRTVWEIGIP